MFTGLIEEVGSVASIQQSPEGSVLIISAKTVLENVKLGDSIAIDGACTTVVAFTPTSFTIEASPETMRKTGFGAYKPGTRVNLERPLTPTSRIGGHYVTGHVDGLATLVRRQPEGNAVIFTFRLLDSELAQFVVEKGSIAIAGISLTVNTVEGDTFSVAIIPHTLAHTTLSDRKVGDTVNIETDLLGKYVKKMLSPTLHTVAPSRVDEAFLAAHGFTP